MSRRRLLTGADGYSEDLIFYVPGISNGEEMINNLPYNNRQSSPNASLIYSWIGYNMCCYYVPGLIDNETSFFHKNWTIEYDVYQPQNNGYGHSCIFALSYYLSSNLCLAIYSPRNSQTARQISVVGEGWQRIIPDGIIYYTTAEEDVWRTDKIVIERNGEDCFLYYFINGILKGQMNYTVWSYNYPVLDGLLSFGGGWTGSQYADKCYTCLKEFKIYNTARL
jgi:hypothetical protein